MKKNYILSKWLNDELTPEELEAFKATPEYAEYEKIKHYTAQLTTPIFDQDDQLKSILNAPKKQVKTTPVYKLWMIRVAAVLVLGLGVFGIKNYVSFSEEAHVQSVNFFLPDDSEVVLNSGSQINYKKWNWNNERALNLSGEAFFKVAKGRKFDVVTQLGKVSVLGTQFNVKNRKERLEVACFEGKVWVKTSKNSVVLHKGEGVILQNDAIVKTESFQDTKPSWMSNEIRLVSSSLEAILYELEQNYDVKIKSSSIKNTSNFTGSLPKDNVEKALEILSKTYNLNYKIVDKKNIEITLK